MIKSKFILLCTFLCFSLVGASQIYTVKQYERKDGLNLTSFLSVKEAEDGYLWFGTDGSGVVRFDGKEFTYFDEIQGRDNKHVSYIEFNEDKILYSTLYNGVYEMSKNTFQQLDYINELGRTIAAVVFEDNEVIVQDGGIKIYKDKQLINEESTFPFKNSTILNGVFKNNNELYIFTSKGNFFLQDKEIRTLDNWMGISGSRDFIGGFVSGRDVVFIHEELSREVIVTNIKNSSPVIEDKAMDNSFLEEGEYIVKWAAKDELLVVLTDKGRILTRSTRGGEYEEIIHNYEKDFFAVTDIEIDNNYDIWLTTRFDGIFRVSLEAFTQVVTGELFKNSYTGFFAPVSEEDFIVSFNGNQINIGSILGSDVYASYEGMRISSLVYIDKVPVISTNRGVYQVVDRKLELFEPLAHLNEKVVSLIYEGLGYYWYGIEGEGLYQQAIEDEKPIHFQHAAAYFYNAKYNLDSTIIYFGSNNGVYMWETDTLINIPSVVKGYDLGHFVGNSTRDVYGTNWFSYDKGLLGITKDREKVLVNESKHLPSLLIYTLNSDNDGRLYIGSNVGITVLEVDENGEVTAPSVTYDENNGFLGYETHMRSSYEAKDGSIYLGTLRGITHIAPEYLDKEYKLNKPVVFSFRNRYSENLLISGKPIELDSENNVILIEFSSVNVKDRSSLLYRYRLKGLNDNWSEWTAKENVVFNQLNTGSYVFEVMASVNGQNVSEITSFHFVVSVPFYKNKWFILSLIVVFIIVGYFLLNRKNDFYSINILPSRDFTGDNRVAKRLMFIGIIVNGIVYVIAPKIDDSVGDYSQLAIVYSLSVAFYFLVLGIVHKKRHLRNEKTFIDIGFLSLIGFNFVLIYLSSLEPFYYINTLMILIGVPYAFQRVRQSIVFTTAYIVLGLFILYLRPENNYNQYFFVINLAITGFLIIGLTRMNNARLEQLIFTSGVINTGNSPVVAFDWLGEISFASESLELMLGINGELRGQHISSLNRYTPDDISALRGFKNLDLTHEFKDGDIFISPFLTEEGKVVYFQWSCKKFPNDLRVIIGQDVTDKVHLENNYEQIVKNADSIIFRATIDGEIIFLNERSITMWSKPIEELKGKSIYNFVHPDYQGEVRAFFNSTLEERKEDAYIEFPLAIEEENSDGKLRWMGLSLSIIYKTFGRNVVDGFLGIGRDVTETKESNEIIRKQNKEITDSINYAKRIQLSMLEKEETVAESFDESFLIFKPKDIVSGDFYWVKRVGNKRIVIVADSTGHGVSGAFITVLGITLLNQIVLDQGITNPAEILQTLDKKLFEAIAREDSITDGIQIEITILLIEDDKKELTYATAGGRFLIVDAEAKESRMVRADRKHIGEEPLEDDFVYENHKEFVEENEVVYIFSDGFPDQFGGELNKKITIKGFVDLLIEHSNKEMSQQEEELQEFLLDWMRDEVQTDDITLIGVKGGW